MYGKLATGNILLTLKINHNNANWFSENTYLDCSDESERAVLPQRYDRCPEWRLDRICNHL